MFLYFMSGRTAFLHCNFKIYLVFTLDGKQKQLVIVRLIYSRVGTSFCCKECCLTNYDLITDI